MIEPRRPCPTCGRETSLLAGIVLYPTDMVARSYRFDVCWADALQRRRGEAEWTALRARVDGNKPSKLKWTIHTTYHWSMYLHGEQLHYWPTKKKIGWRNQAHKGVSQAAAAKLAEKLHSNPEAQL